MPKIEFEYEGQKFKATVPDGFRSLPLKVQQDQLFEELQKRYGQVDKIGCEQGKPRVQPG